MAESTSSTEDCLGAVLDLSVVVEDDKEIEGQEDKKVDHEQGRKEIVMKEDKDCVQPELSGDKTTKSR